MFTNAQSEYLLRKLQRNEVTLFVGAGFSLNAKNRLKQNLPTGKDLAEKIWKFIPMRGTYDGTSLWTMYDLLLNSGKKTNQIKDFLEDIFLVKDFPDYYYGISLPFWYKIYTTNIDDFLEKIYAKKKDQQYKIFRHPKDDYEDVDKSLNFIQFIYLNGKVPCDPDELIFSRKQYARSYNALQPLYHQFVCDYATTSTIFLGTSIDEPIFEQYIAARETRKRGIKEYRPQSFLIDPHIPVARATLLKELYNIEPIIGSTEDFIRWLTDNQDHFGDRIETLKITLPSLYEFYERYSDKKYNSLENRLTNSLLDLTESIQMRDR